MVLFSKLPDYSEYTGIAKGLAMMTELNVKVESCSDVSELDFEKNDFKNKYEVEPDEISAEMIRHQPLLRRLQCSCSQERESQTYIMNCTRHALF